MRMIKMGLVARRKCIVQDIVRLKHLVSQIGIERIRVVHQASFGRRVVYRNIVQSAGSTELRLPTIAMIPWLAFL